MVRVAKTPEFLVGAYLDVKRTLIAWGFGGEIDWQADLINSHVSDRQFLSEYTWVVLSCGMADVVVRKVFPGVSSAFFNWDLEEIREHGVSRCGDQALTVFANRLKIAAIVDVVQDVLAGGLASVQVLVAPNPLRELQRLPFIGPTSVYHLAKNLGLNVCKPDRHLIRLAEQFAFSDVDSLCESIVRMTGEPLAVVDLVLWRYLERTADYALEPNKFYRRKLHVVKVIRSRP